MEVDLCDEIYRSKRQKNEETQYFDTVFYSFLENRIHSNYRLIGWANAYRFSTNWIFSYDTQVHETIISLFFMFFFAFLLPFCAFFLYFPSSVGFHIFLAEGKLKWWSVSREENESFMLKKLSRKIEFENLKI